MSVRDVLPLPARWNNFVPVTSAAVKERSLGRPSGGLATLFDPNCTTYELLEKNNLFSLILCTISSIQFILGTIYVRPQADLGAALDLLQNSLDQTRDRYPDMPIILGGDFNARVGSLGENLADILDGTCLFPESQLLDPPCPPKGAILTTFMAENGFFLLNGRTTNDHPGQYTFVGHQGKSTIDLVYINLECTNFILDLSVLPHVSLSDHLPVCLKIALPTTTQTICTPQGDSGATRTDRLRWDKTKQAAYADSITTQLQLDPPTDARHPTSDDMNDELISIIRTAAEQTGMLLSISARGNTKPSAIWFDHDCALWKKKLAVSLKLAKKNNFADPFREEFLSTKKHYKFVTENKKLAYDAQIRDKFTLVRNSKEFWAAFRSLKRGSISTNPIQVNDWISFYNSVFPPRIQTFNHFLDISDPFLDPPFSMNEIHRAITKIKPGKAPGPDGIGSDFLKALPQSGVVFLLNLCNQVLASEHIPTSWTSATLTLIHKKGDTHNPRNYRGIALLNNPLKLFTSMLNDRLTFWADANAKIPESQSGFRKSRSCLDNIFVLQNCIQSEIKSGNKYMYGIFIDFERAFDSVPHAKLFDKLYTLGCSAKLVRILGNLYNRANFRVQVNGVLSDNVQVTEGVLQGEVLSPLLFSLYISDLENYLREHGLEGCSVNATTDILILFFADDIVILARSQAIVMKTLRLLEIYCEKNSLKVNTKKTKIINFKQSGRPKSCNFYYNGNVLETVNEYPYLGVIISSSSLGLRAAKSAIAKTKIAMSSIISLCNSAKIDSWPARLKLYDSTVTATLLYAAPFWALCYVELVERVQMEFFKRLLNLPRTTANYSVRLELNITKLALKILAAAISFIVRVLLLPDDRFPKICLMRQFETYRRNDTFDKFLWLSHLHPFLESIDMSHLLLLPDARTWSESGPIILERYGNHLRLLDLINYNDSDSMSIRIPRALHDNLAFYLSHRIQFYFVKILAQLRLSSKNYIKFTVRNISYSIAPNETCKICNLKVPESLSHFMLECPAYAPFRNRFLQPILAQNFLHLDNLLYLGLTCEADKMKSIAFYVSNSLRLRSFCLNE